MPSDSTQHSRAAARAHANVLRNRRGEVAGRPRLQFISNICRFAQKISESNVDRPTEWRRFHIGRRVFKYALTIDSPRDRTREVAAARKYFTCPWVTGT
jgi:hypothetical protein